jgi:glycosyltransferase involved in cell wall biosynthesis
MMKTPIESTENKNPLVSVCIPVFNSVNYVGETIDSILAQGYPNLEVIVQDNVSTDGTWELLQKLAKEHPQLSIAQNRTNVGMTPNFNIAINRARGDYVMAISSDDKLEPAFMDKCMQTFREYGADVVTANHYFLRGDSKTVRKIDIKEGVYSGFAREVLRLNPFSINFTLFKKETIDRMRVNGDLFACDFYTCDLDLWYRMAFAGVKVYYIEEPLAIYRYHDKNLSNQVFKMESQALAVLLSHGAGLKMACGLDYRIRVIKEIGHNIITYRPGSAGTVLRLIRELA